MSLLYLYRFKFAVKLQIILFENAIIGHFATRAVSGQFQALLLGNPLGLLFSVTRFFQGKLPHPVS
jgi:hypothetical protein